MLTPFRADGEDLLVAVRLTPKGGRDSVDGVSQMADGKAVLLARVRAAPTEGQANAALLPLLAKSFGVPKRDVQFHSGETARLKMIRLIGGASRLNELTTKFSAQGQH